MTLDERQTALLRWCNATIPTDVDLETRLSRALEEMVEFVQACGLPLERQHAILEYVNARDPGEPRQEVGGIMVTLSLACEVQGISINDAFEAEFERIHQPEVIEKVRRRQAEKRAAGF